MIKFFFFFFLLNFILLAKSEYNEDKIPKPNINKFNTLKASDLTGRYQINTSLGGNIWLWDNLNDSQLTFNVENISLGLDKYLLFYDGLTANLSHNLELSLTSLSLGYKLKLYEFFYSKLGAKSALYPYWDFGLSASIGVEFSLFNVFRIFSYTDFTIFLLNKRNLTTIYLNYYLGVGVYF